MEIEACNQQIVGLHGVYGYGFGFSSYGIPAGEIHGLLICAFQKTFSRVNLYHVAESAGLGLNRFLNWVR